MSHSSFLYDAASGFDIAACVTNDAIDTSGETPFHDAESAWFWCVRVSDAIHSGARSGSHPNTTYPNSAWGSGKRPCEAVDIQNIVLRLHANRTLTDKHVHVLSRYGKKRLRPSAAHDRLHWQQAMNHLTPILQHKGIIAA